MIDNLNDLWSVLIGSVLIFMVLYAFYHKHIISFLDPLFFYIIAQSFTIELAFKVIDDVQYLINFLGCELCFITAFLIAAGKPLNKNEFLASKLFIKIDTAEVSLVKWYAFIGLIVLLIANIILIKINGLILLADDPSIAKVQSFTGGSGLGIVKRMNLGILYFVGLSIAVLFLLKNNIKYLGLFFLLLMIPATGGSKGALLYFVILISLLSCFADIRRSKSFTTLKAGSIFILVLAVFLITVLISNGESGDTLQDKLFKLVTRFLFFGDSIIYYYNHSSVHYFSNNNFISFINDETNSILGLFRIVPYKLPMGYRLINYYYNINSDTFGPNVPYYIQGNIYFGYYGAFIFSFIIGFIIGFVRKLFYNLVRKGTSSIIYALLILHLNLIITTFAQDSQLFITELNDTLFLSLPILAASSILHLPIIMSRRRHLYS